MFFLVERAHVVLGGGLPRRDSKIYRLNLLIFVVWAGECISPLLAPADWPCLGIFVAISVSHRSTLNPLMQSSCEFEIGTYAIATAMGMDVLSNTYLMLLFVVPLLRTRISSAALRSLAKKSIVAAAVSTLSSAANMTLMAWKHGGKSSWLCMLLCSLDVTICSTAIFFVRVPSLFQASLTLVGHDVMRRIATSDSFCSAGDARVLQGSLRSDDREQGEFQLGRGRGKGRDTVALLGGRSRLLARRRFGGAAGSSRAEGQDGILYTKAVLDTACCNSHWIKVKI